MILLVAEKTKIILNAFVRKCFDAYLLKAIIRDSGAHLSRKGRSRNWMLIADAKQISLIINEVEAAEQPSWLWLAKLLREKKQSLTQQELLNLVKLNPAISTNQLIALTDCTLVQARQVLDEAEWMDD